MSSLKTCEVHPKMTHQVNQEGLILQQMKPLAPVVAHVATQWTHLMNGVPNFPHGAQLRSQGALDPLICMWGCAIGQKPIFFALGHFVRFAKKCTPVSSSSLFLCVRQTL